MQFIIKIFVILSLSRGLAMNTENRPIHFLKKLLEMIEKKASIETIMVVQSQSNNNCTLLDWNPDSTAILRSNEQAKIAVKGNFNSRALAVICISEVSDLHLLKTVALAFEHMRQERVILWIQRTFSNKILEEISKEVSGFRFRQVLALQVENHLTGLVSVHRLQECPGPHFVKFDNFSELQDSLFGNHPLNFCGATIVVKVPPDPALLQYQHNLFKSSSLLIQRQELELDLFALKYNLKAKMIQTSDNISFDIQLSSRLITKKTLANHDSLTNPFRTTSFIVIVPCAQERSIKDVFKQLDVPKWLLYVLHVYVTLVLAEIAIIMVTERISGRVCRLTRLIFLFKLSAFRAILGLSFPITRRASLSLRQLFLAMSLFGMVFSNYFGCKMIALFTKHSHNPQVTNFEELRESGLTVLVDPRNRPFIETEVEPDFFQRVLPQAKFLPTVERQTQLFSLNDSNGYVIFEDNWEVFNRFQLWMGRKAFCTSKDLAIIRNLPRDYTLQKNSIFKKPLSVFSSWIEEAGIPMHWKTEAHLAALKILNITTQPFRTPKAVPLCLQQMKWLGLLLILGYCVATLVFLFEICLHRRNMGNSSSVA